VNEPQIQHRGATRRSFKRIAFVVLMIAGVVGAVEVISAIAYHAFVPEQRRTVIETALGLERSESNSVLRYRPHPYLNYVSNSDFAFESGVRPHDPIGIRSSSFPLTEKRPDVFRVVALGGSTTYGMYFEDGDRVWVGLTGLALRETLELEVEVINAAVPNYTTCELLGMATLWLPEFRPDLVLLHVGLNDAFTVGFPDEGGPDNSGFRFSWSYRPMPPAVRAAMRASYFFRLSGNGWLARSGHQIGDLTTAMQYPVPPDDQLDRNLRSATGKYFRRNVETLIALIRLTGAEPVLVNMPLNPAYEQGMGVYYDGVSDAVVRNNRIMAELAEKHGVALVDAYSRMRARELYYDAAHLNQDGMVRKAQAVADVILPRLTSGP
jgi:lysophospholipase L1-like esterase